MPLRLTAVGRVPLLAAHRETVMLDLGRSERFVLRDIRRLLLQRLRERSCGAPANIREIYQSPACVYNIGMQQAVAAFVIEECLSDSPLQRLLEMIGCRGLMVREQTVAQLRRHQKAF